MRIEMISNMGTKMNCLGIYGRKIDAQNAIISAMLEKDLVNGVEYYNPSKRYHKVTRGRIAITDMSFIQEDVWLDRWTMSSGVCHYEIQRWNQNDVDGLDKKYFFNFDYFMKDHIVKNGWNVQIVKDWIKNKTIDINNADTDNGNTTTCDMFHISPLNWKASIESDSREAWNEAHGYEEAGNIQTHPFSIIENTLTVLMY